MDLLQTHKFFSQNRRALFRKVGKQLKKKYYNNSNHNNKTKTVAYKTCSMVHITWCISHEWLDGGGRSLFWYAILVKVKYIS